MRAEVKLAAKAVVTAVPVVKAVLHAAKVVAAIAAATGVNAQSAAMARANAAMPKPTLRWTSLPLRQWKPPPAVPPITTALSDPAAMVSAATAASVGQPVTRLLPVQMPPPKRLVKLPH